MVRLSIDTMWNSFMIYIAIGLCSLVVPSQQTGVFSPSLFQAADKSSSCPPDARRKLMSCKLKLQPLNSMGQVPSNKALGDGCIEGYFFDALNCIERVMLNCRHDKSDEAHFLRSTINVANMRKSIIYFCTNIKTYVSNLECIQGSHPTIATCGKKAKETFLAQIQATANLDSQMIFQCAFYNKAVSCITSVLKSRCNKEISNMVFTVMAGLEPPICTKSTYSISAGRQQNNSSSYIQMYLSLQCLCFVFVVLFRGGAGVRW